MLIDNIVEVLYEDKDIIVVVKPAGVEAQTSRYFEKDLESILKNYFSKKNESTYLGLIHRLDKAVSGIMVFGKNKKSANALSKAFSDRTVVKKYLALACGKLVDKCGKLENYLYQDKKLKKAFIVNADNKEAKKAVLEYRLIKEYKLAELDLSKEPIKVDLLNEYVSLLEISLGTGRFHQIRAQLSNIGNSIIGDRKYSNDDEDNLEILSCLGEKNIMLASYYLEFKHPNTNKIMKFEKYPSWIKYLSKEK